MTGRGSELEETVVTAVAFGLLALMFFCYVLFCCHVWKLHHLLLKMFRRSTRGAGDGAAPQAGGHDGAATGARTPQRAGHIWHNGETTATRHNRAFVTPPPRYSAVYAEKDQTTVHQSTSCITGSGAAVMLWRVLVEASDCSVDLPVFDSPAVGVSRDVTRSVHLTPLPSPLINSSVAHPRGDSPRPHTPVSVATQASTLVHSSAFLATPDPTTVPSSASLAAPDPTTVPYSAPSGRHTSVPCLVLEDCSGRTGSPQTTACCTTICKSYTNLSQVQSSTIELTNMSVVDTTRDTGYTSANTSSATMSGGRALSNNVSRSDRNAVGLYHKRRYICCCRMEEVSNSSNQSLTRSNLVICKCQVTLDSVADSSHTSIQLGLDNLHSDYSLNSIAQNAGKSRRDVRSTGSYLDIIRNSSENNINKTSVPSGPYSETIFHPSDDTIRSEDTSLRAPERLPLLSEPLVSVPLLSEPLLVLSNENLLDLYPAINKNLSSSKAKVAHEDPPSYDGVICVRVLVPTGQVSSYVEAAKTTNMSREVYIALLEPHPVYPIKACSVQVWSGHLTVDLVSIECLSDTMELVESYTYGMI